MKKELSNPPIMMLPPEWQGDPKLKAWGDKMVRRGLAKWDTKLPPTGTKLREFLFPT